MSTQRFLLASLAAFVVIAVLEFVIHGVLLQGLYRQNASVFRPEMAMQARVWLFYVAYVIYAALFTFIYSKGYEKDKGGLGQGLRYGLYIGVMIGALQSLIWYVVLPIPAALAVAWFLAPVVVALVTGALVGSIYIPR